MLVDDTLAAEDGDYYDEDDIGEYDDQQPAQRSSGRQEQSKSSTQQQQQSASSSRAAVPPSVAAMRPVVMLTGSVASTGGERRGRTGRDAVDVGELTLDAMAELDRGIEAERQQRQAAAQRLAEERAAKWQSDSMLSKVMPSAARGQAGQQQQQQQRSSPTPFTSVRRGGKAAAGAMWAAMRGGGNTEAKLVSLHEAYRVQAKERVGLGAVQTVAVRRSVAVSGKRKAGELMVSSLCHTRCRTAVLHCC